MSVLQAPFAYFGGKSRVSGLVWSRFGVVANYVEPFFGSGAVLLRRPVESMPEGNSIETVNDADAHVANFWRAIRHDPDATADAADRPVSELDLHAVGDALFIRPSNRWPEEPKDWADWLRADETHYCPERAGCWAWFLSNWIGGLPSIDASENRNEAGVHRKRPHLGDAGKGVSRRRPHLSNAGMGVSRKRPHLGNAGMGECARRRQVLLDWFGLLADRLRNVRVCCGDWSRVCGPSVTGAGSPCGVFLDPPYSAEAGRDNRLYSTESATVAHDVREWCLANGNDKSLRIALCGYEGEHDMPGWECVEWKTHGGYANQGDGAGRENAHRERIWFSPGCIKVSSVVQSCFNFEGEDNGQED